MLDGGFTFCVGWYNIVKLVIFRCFAVYRLGIGLVLVILGILAILVVLGGFTVSLPFRWVLDIVVLVVLAVAC